MAERRELVRMTIMWTAYSNDDIDFGDDEPPEADEGWYVEATLANGMSFEIGRDHFGPGYPTLDEALAEAEKWAVDRGFVYTRPIVTFNVAKPLPEDATELKLANKEE